MASLWRIDRKRVRREKGGRLGIKFIELSIVQSSKNQHHRLGWMRVVFRRHLKKINI